MRWGRLARVAAWSAVTAGVALGSPPAARGSTDAGVAGSAPCADAGGPAAAPAAPAGGAPPAASAPAPAPSYPSDPDAARLAAAGHSLKWNWTPPGRVERYGHAETLIHAPLAVVRARVLDFSHYRDIIPSRFKISRVIGRPPDGSADVYIQILVMHDMVLLWDVTRFSPVRHEAPGIETVEGRMVPGKGNVEDMDVVWTMHELGPDWTVLKMDLLLKPGLPAPQSAIDEELRDSAMMAVDLVHDRAQGSHGVGPWPG